eukprot:scaffold315845_cov18-Prasinocladus_malaysianus.AAC.1
MSASVTTTSRYPPTPPDYQKTWFEEKRANKLEQINNSPYERCRIEQDHNLPSSKLTPVLMSASGSHRELSLSRKRCEGCEHDDVWPWANPTVGLNRVEEAQGKARGLP